MEGRLWHKTGNNRTRDERRGGDLRLLHAADLPHAGELVPVAEPERAALRLRDLLTLLGYKADGLGLVNGASPQ